jgi:hypothetical protein
MILLAAVTAVLLTVSAAAGAQTAAAATPRCTTATLEVWLGVGGGGQAGSIAYPMELTNVSGHACHLFGFPGVSAELAGRQAGSAARRDRTPCSRSRMSPRSRRRTASRLAAGGLTVYPPGAVNAAQIPFRFRACSAKGPRFLEVEPVQPRVGIPGHP